MPSFSSTAASTTEPAVGASVCASGSQVCSGTTGTFTRKAIANATKQRRAVLVASCCPSASVTRSNVMPLSGEPSTAVAMIATSSSAEPAIV